VKLWEREIERILGYRFCTVTFSLCLISWLTIQSRKEINPNAILPFCRSSIGALLKIVNNGLFHTDTSNDQDEADVGGGGGGEGGVAGGTEAVEGGVVEDAGGAQVALSKANSGLEDVVERRLQ